MESDRTGSGRIDRIGNNSVSCVLGSDRIDKIGSMSVSSVLGTGGGVGNVRLIPLG
jgi:hypothetical protein